MSRPATLAAPPGGWRVPLVRPDLPAYADVAGEIEAAVADGMLTKGPALARLEAAAAAHLGVRHVVGVANCTVGLALVLRSLAAVRAQAAAGCTAPATCPLPAAGRRPAAAGAAEVIVPSFIFLAAPAAIEWAGLEPVFVDVDPATFTVDPAAVAAAVTPRTAAILACHTFGCPCDVAALERISVATGVPVVIDAAHGLGSSVAGKPVGAGGLAQVFSLSPTKLVVAGEGGLVATSCDCLAAALRVAREYGNDGGYGCAAPGLNARLAEIPAILARASLARLDAVAARRRAAAEAYRAALADVPGISFQSIPAGAESSWKDFVVAVDPSRCAVDRDGLRARLADRGIETRAYYAPAAHQMEAFRGRLRPGQRFPVTERLAATLVALPMGAHVTPDVARTVADEIRAAASRAGVASGSREPVA
ncbi:MAG: DegT/DnrJ/EryC1/StrS family aminotransferase [Planctomycetaceae bacterium]